MVLLLADGSFVQGAEALQVISNTLRPQGFAAKLMRSLGYGKVRARMLYPFLHLGRRLSLLLLWRSSKIQ